MGVRICSAPGAASIARKREAYLLERNQYRKGGNETLKDLGKPLGECRIDDRCQSFQVRIDQLVAAHMPRGRGDSQNNGHIVGDQRGEGGHEYLQPPCIQFAKDREFQGKWRVRQYMAEAFVGFGFYFGINIKEVGPPRVIELFDPSPGTEMAATRAGTLLVDRTARARRPISAQYARRLLERRIDDGGLLAADVARAAFAVRNRFQEHVALVPESQSRIDLVQKRNSYTHRRGLRRCLEA